MRFPLCKNCLARNTGCRLASTAKNESGCAICHGAFSQIPSLSKSALSQNSFEWSSFFFSSSITPDWLISEELLWDSTPSCNWQSLKNELNRQSIAAISRAGKAYLPRNADAQVSFNFQTGAALVRPLPLFLLSHYQKLSREISQSIWHCGKCRGRGCSECGNSGASRDSVERVLSGAAKNAFRAEGAKLHASGREDIDVLMQGTGRPFVLEITSPKVREPGIIAFTNSINATGLVHLEGGAKKVGAEFVEIACNSHFEKEYVALVSADRALTQNDCNLLSGKAYSLSQQTPSRVLARRSDLVRKRSITVQSAMPAGFGCMRLHLLAEAGSYIKEFIHSDRGRTRPSVSEILSCFAQCKELNVVRIHDGFIGTCGL